VYGLYTNSALFLAFFLLAVLAFSGFLNVQSPHLGMSRSSWRPILSSWLAFLYALVRLLSSPFICFIRLCPLLGVSCGFGRLVLTVPNLWFLTVWTRVVMHFSFMSGGPWIVDVNMPSSSQSKSFQARLTVGFGHSICGLCSLGTSTASGCGMSCDVPVSFWALSSSRRGSVSLTSHHVVMKNLVFGQLTVQHRKGSQYYGSRLGSSCVSPGITPVRCCCSALRPHAVLAWWMRSQLRSLRTLPHLHLNKGRCSNQCRLY